MIKKITITNHVGEDLELFLRIPEEPGFLITDISGLGPAKASINTSTIAADDGASFSNARLDMRNIVMTLRFMAKTPKEMEALRLDSYKFFSIKKRLKFSIQTDYRDAYCYGYVESNEPVIFSDKCECQISIVCPDPYFQSAESQVTVFTGVIPKFEFPFENVGLDPMLEMGELYVKRGLFLTYLGDADVGCTIIIEARGPIQDLAIHNTTTGDRMTISDERLTRIVGSGLVNGDVLTINTVKGQKMIDLYRQGVHYNIMNSLDKHSKWLKLIRGDNSFMYSVTAGGDNVSFRIENVVLYEGV